MSQNVNLSASKNYEDYTAKLFFADYGLINTKFSTKQVEMDNGAKVTLFHLTAENPTDGHRVEVDFWPNKCQTLEDIKAIPENPQDIVIRFGTYTDETTGETVESDSPKVVAYIVNGKDVVWHGNKPEWDAENSKSVWSNKPSDE